MSLCVISSQDAQYQSLCTGLDTLQTVMTPRLKLFKKLPLSAKKQWLKKDILLRKTLKLLRDGADYIEAAREEDLT